MAARRVSLREITGAHGTEPQKTNYSAPPQELFPMFKPALKMDRIEEVGQVRRPHLLERRPQRRDLLVRSSARNLPLRRVPGRFALSGRCPAGSAL